MVLASCGGSSGAGDAIDGLDAEVGEVDVSPDEGEVEGDEGTGADGDADVESEAEGGADADADDGGIVGLPVGSACTDGSECLDGTVPGECVRALVGLTFPDGYCTAVGCTGDSDCPGGAVEAACLPSTSGVSWCVDRCDPGASDCRSGYVCIDPDAIGPLSAACLPLCRTDTDCAAGQTCDSAGDPPVCRNPGGASNGGPCATSADCAVGSACVAEDTSFTGAWPASGPPGGVCIQKCVADADCTNDGVCVLSCGDQNSTKGDDCDDDGVAGLDSDAAGICLDGCDPSDPGACPRTGYSCQAVGENPGGPANVCTVDCTEGGCTMPGWECDPSAGFGSLEFGAGRCQPPFDPDRLGEACTFTSGCEGGTCLAETYTGAPGGTCIEECREGAGGDPCPGSSICLARPGEIGICARSCTPGGTDCRPGWECTRVVIVDICEPACTSNDQCDNDCCRADGSGYCDLLRVRCM